MSTCPDLELQSAFFDGEIGSPWYDEIKSHVESCSDCKKTMDNLQTMHDVFAADSAQMNLSQKQMDESFDRLQSRLRYTKTTEKANVIHVDFARKVIPYAAAAAFLAAVILPSANVRTQVKQQIADIALITPTRSVELIDKAGIAADQSLNVAAVKVSNTSNTSAVQTTPVALHVSNLTKVDIFKPELSANQSVINVTLPDVKAMPFADASDLPLINAEGVQTGVYSVDTYR